MRPIKLKLKNFGPFKSETIDFTDFHGKMFLLTGPTGAGKSMIFNGILYALYGSDSRHKTLRSQFASEDEKSVVTLEFEMGNKTYIVERTMTIHREEKSDVPPKALLMFKDGDTIASGMKSVSDAVLDVVHLNEHQFKQILLLPQGAFKEFLVSSSDEKSKILSTIFNAERFIYFEKSLERDVKSEKARIEKLYLKLDHIFTQVKYERLESEDLKESAAAAQGLEQQLEFINHVNQLIEEKITEVEENARFISEQQEKLQSDIKSREQHNEYVKRYNALKEEKHQLDLQKDDISGLRFRIEQYKNAQLMKHQLRMYDSNHHSLKDNKKKHGQLTEDNEKLIKEIENLKTQQETLNENEQSILEYTSYIQSTERFIEDDTYKNIDEKVEQSEVLVNQLKSDVETQDTAYEKLEEKQKQLTVSEDEEAILDDRIEKIKADIIQVKLHIKYKKLEAQIESVDIKIKESDAKRLSLLKSMDGKHAPEDRAAIEHLTSHLEAGDNCPVCSKIIETLPEHQFYDDETTGQLNEYKANIERLNEERLSLEVEMKLVHEEIETHSESNLDTLTSKLETLIDKNETLVQAQKDMSEKKKEYYKTFEALNQLSKVISQITAEYNEMKNEREKLETRRNEFINYTKVDAYQTFKTQYEKYKKLVYEHLEKRKMLEENIQKHKQDIAVGTERINHLNEQIDDHERNAQTLEVELSDFIREQAIEDIDTLRMILERDITEAQTSVKRHDEMLHTLSIKIASHIENKTTEAKTIHEEEREQLTSLIESNQSHVKQMTLLSNDLQQNNQLLEEIDQLGQTIKDDIHAFNQLHKIYEVIVGKGGHGISLHRFVLTYHLDRVLAHANIRLGDMTNGRYTLIRTNDANRKGTAAGLEIRVNDSFSGRMRHVDTLSGGETFQASLALALAINEIIIQSSGGIQLDTMLIDEGFGTLDQETLNQAIESLLSLEMSGKMVGIISHVEELKHRLEYKIEVIPNNDTSTTKLHV